MDFLDDSAEGEVLETPVKPGTIRIILADSQAIYRVGIRKVFALEDDLRVVAQADSLRICGLLSSAFPPTLFFWRGACWPAPPTSFPSCFELRPT